MTKHWRQGLERLLENQQQTEYFVKKLLRRILEEEVIIQKLRVNTPDKQKKLPGTVAAVLELTVLTNRQKRDIKLIICQKTSDKEPKTAVILRYYCVEAPAILVDSGAAQIRVTIDSELENLIWQAGNDYEKI